MKRSTGILATLAIAPFALLVGCGEGDMDMEEFEEQQMEQQEQGGGEPMQPPADEGMQQPPQEGGEMPEERRLRELG